MAKGLSERDWAVGGGVAVILATGFAALQDRSVFGGGTVGVVLAGAIVVLTIGGAIALSRFIASHGDDIGEARFDTRNKDDREP